jgi:5-amino-6-(5-phosphoribosylamino)uracil reductase
VRQLLPQPLDDVDLEDCYLGDPREPVGARPWVTVNMASSVDGATALTGRSGGLGGAADRLAFHALRSAADVILVGAGTARAEHYGPVRGPDAHVERRRAAGRNEPARIAVVTRGLDLDLDTPLFTDNDVRPLVFTSSRADPERRRAVQEVADVVDAGDVDVELDRVVAHLGADGVRCVVCEGGPTLNGFLIALGLIDEWCWTIGPLLAGGTSSRASHGSAPLPAHPMVLDRLLTDGRDLLTRYLTSRDS